MTSTIDYLNNIDINSCYIKIPNSYKNNDIHTKIHYIFQRAISKIDIDKLSERVYRNDLEESDESRIRKIINIFYAYRIYLLRELFNKSEFNKDKNISQYINTLFDHFINTNKYICTMTNDYIDDILYAIYMDIESYNRFEKSFGKRCTLEELISKLKEIQSKYDKDNEYGYIFDTSAAASAPYLFLGKKVDDNQFVVIKSTDYTLNRTDHINNVILTSIYNKDKYIAKNKREYINRLIIIIRYLMIEKYNLYKKLYSVHKYMCSSENQAQYIIDTFDEIYKMCDLFVKSCKFIQYMIYNKN